MNKLLNNMLWVFYSLMVIILIYPVGEILCESMLGNVVFAIFYVLCVLNPLSQILKEINEN